MLFLKSAYVVLDRILPQSINVPFFIGLIVLLVVTAVGTAMLLSISKIWGNHRGNIWLNDNNQMTLSDQDFIERISPSRGRLSHDRFLHPKDLSTFLFQYEISQRHPKKQDSENNKNGNDEQFSDSVKRPTMKNKKVDKSKKMGSKNENEAKKLKFWFNSKLS